MSCCIYIKVLLFYSAKSLILTPSYVGLCEIRIKLTFREIPSQQL